MSVWMIQLVSSSDDLVILIVNDCDVETTLKQYQGAGYHMLSQARLDTPPKGGLYKPFLVAINDIGEN